MKFPKECLDSICNLKINNVLIIRNDCGDYVIVRAGISKDSGKETINMHCTNNEKWCKVNDFLIKIDAPQEDTQQMRFIVGRNLRKVMINEMVTGMVDSDDLNDDVYLGQML